MIVQGAKIQADVVVTNNEPVAVTVTFLPTCTCVEVTPGSQSIPAGGRASFSMRYDSIDDRGLTIKGYLVSTDLTAASPLYYLLRGTVREQRGTPALSSAGTLQGPGPVTGGGPGAPISVTYYYTPGCRSCEEFLSVEIPRLEKLLGRRIELQKRDLLDTAQYEELTAFASARGEAITAIPRFTFGSVDLQSGLDLVPLIMGLFGISEVLLSLEDMQHGEGAGTVRPTPKIWDLLPNSQDWRRSAGPMRGESSGRISAFTPIRSAR